MKKIGWSIAMSLLIMPSVHADGSKYTRYATTPICTAWVSFPTTDQQPRIATRESCDIGMPEVGMTSGQTPDSLSSKSQITEFVLDCAHKGAIITHQVDYRGQFWTDVLAERRPDPRLREFASFSKELGAAFRYACHREGEIWPPWAVDSLAR